MTLSFHDTFLLAILLTSVSCCQGCRESTREVSKPAEQQSDRPTPENSPREETSPEAPLEQDVEKKDEAEETDQESAANEGDAGQDNNSGSTGSSDEGNQSTGSGEPSSSNAGAAQPTFSSPRFESAEAALAYAKQQREKSSKLSGGGDTAAAYEEALQGWQALQSHLADKGCGSLSGDLLDDLEKYGEQLGSKGISIIEKPLKIK